MVRATVSFSNAKDVQKSGGQKRMALCSGHFPHLPDSDKKHSTSLILSAIIQSNINET
jgi:hypothetical protein